MSDFFGGILDDIRNTGDDVNSFFGGALSKGVQSGISGMTNYGLSQDAVTYGNRSGLDPQQVAFERNAGLLKEANSLAELNNVGGDRGTHNPEERGYAPVGEKTHPAPAENYENVEQAWIRRMLRFSQLDSATGPKVNEKGP